MLIVTTVLIAYSQSGRAIDARTYQYRYRPLQMGTQITIVDSAGSRWCSLGFPAYYEDVDYNLRIVIVTYGVVTAAHCGLRDASVYQNVTGTNNYIGYLREEGRYYVSDVIADSSIPVDAAFIVVESYSYPIGGSRPLPQVVSNLVHELGASYRVTEYLSSERTLWEIYNRSARVIKAGRTTGFEDGRIIQCGPGTIICRWNGEWVFLISAYAARGDSGGLIYWNYTVRTPYDIQVKLMGLGITVATTGTECISVDGVTMCRHTVGNLLYNITRVLNVTPYRG
jgi:hypothetical protein